MTANWTKAQASAIAHRGSDLLVSAGAGAGKTATLVERLVQFLMDPVAPAAIDEFLVVTFTRDAAEEMRSRIARRLDELLRDPDVRASIKPHLEQQLFLVPRAPISTIHSFCLDLITAHATRIGLPPTFEIMAEDEEQLFRNAMAADHLESLIEKDELRASMAILLEGQHPLGAPDGLLHLLHRIVRFLESLPDAERFVGDIRALWREATEAPVWQESPLGKRITEIYRKKVRATLQKCDFLLRLRSSAEGTNSRESFLAVLTDLRATLFQAREGSPDGTLRFDEGLRVALRFTKKRGVDDPLSELWKEIKDDFLSDIADIASISSISQNEYFRPRADAADILLEELALGLIRKMRAEQIANRRISFSMLEHLALELLRPSETLPEISPGKFKEILVDEFQDISPIQAELFDLLATNSDSNPTRFLVGDIKQSIYAFRMAAPELFQGIMESSIPLEEKGTRHRVELRENFRSAHAILHEINNIFTDLFARELGGIEYDDAHRFIPGRPLVAATDARLSPTIALDIISQKAGHGDDESEDDNLPGEQVEARHVAKLIAGIGPPWEDIVVLVRSRAGTIGPLSEEFDLAGIPWDCLAPASLLHAPEVVEIITLLRAIHNPFDDIAILGVLRGAAASWGADDLLRLCHSITAPTYRERLEHVAQDAESPLRERANAFLASLKSWQEMAERIPVRSIIARLCEELHLEERAAVRPGGDRRVRHIERLLELAGNFDGFARRGLRRFLAYLDELEASDNGPATAEDEADPKGAVRIITSHKSKGREFPIVVIPFTGKMFNEGDLRAPILLDRTQGAAFRRLVRSSADEDDPIYDDLAGHRRRAMLGEEMRLLYVALTRARERLIITGTTRRKPEVIADWGDMSEPLSVETRSGARSPLDWLMMHAMRRFQPTYGALAKGDWAASDRAFHARLMRPDGSLPIDAKVAELADAPALDALRATAMARLDARREIQSSGLVAKLSVSEVKRAWDARAGLSGESTTQDSGAERIAWRADAPTQRGAQAGTATHKFLAIAELPEIARGRSLSEERDRLIAAGKLSSEEAALVLLDGIAAFMNGELGMSLMQNAATAQREVPFTVGVDPEEILKSGKFETRGPVILQGVVDLYFRQADGGIVLIDFKTDDPGEGGVRIQQLIKTYRPQLLLYRAALERALGESIASTHLAFLRANVTAQIPTAAPAREELARLLRPAATMHERPDARPSKGGRV
jgi:ATP-dependent helicase/nuclease subunit A